MKEKSYKMLTFTDKDIKKDIPGIIGLCNNFSPMMAKIIVPHLVKFMAANGYVLPECATNAPKLDRNFSVEGKHVFVFHDPELRVYCRKYGERMIVREIWFEFIHIK